MFRVMMPVQAAEAHDALVPEVPVESRDAPLVAVPVGSD
jgi:hypothetical protein